MSSPTRTRSGACQRRGGAGYGTVIDAIHMIESIGAGRAVALDRLKAATRNARDGATMLQVVRGALSGIAGRLAAMRILAVQKTAESRSDEERAALDRQFAEHRAEIDRIADGASFSGVRLLSGGTWAEVAVEQVASQLFFADGLGFHLRAEAGFATFRFAPNTPAIEADDRIRVEYASAGPRFTVSNTTTGQIAHARLPRQPPPPPGPGSRCRSKCRSSA